ncbi:MAG TPA: hypothetical protein VGL61_24690 [Kofleriaceae bacterium]|jgi:hypothetical protein
MRAAIQRLITARAILVAGWLWFLVYAFPGYMSYDSEWQLVQARHIEGYNEWHPPMMAAMWRVLDHVISGPFLMLVLQSGLFAGGLYLVMRRLISDRMAAIAAAAILLIPQNIIVMAVIWKDSQMAGFLIAGIAALLSQKRGWRITGYVLLVFATAVRYNAAAATFPIVLGLFATRIGRPRWRHYALATSAWLAITASAFVANDLLVDHKLYPWETASAPVDIAGVLRYSKKLDNDTLLAETPGVPWAHTDKIQIRARMQSRPESNFLTLTEGPGALFVYPTTDDQRAALKTAWIHLVFAHPWAFVRHRWGLFRALLTQYAGVWSSFYDGDWASPELDIKGSHSAIQEAWIHAMEKVADTPLFSGWVFLILAIVLLCFRPHDRVTTIIVVSGALYELALFWIAPALDYRYSHWMVVTAIIGATRVFAQRYQQGSRTRPT